jgi:hypothetical protein
MTNDQDGPMPSGVAVSETERIFVNFPRWFDPVEFTGMPKISSPALSN